MHVKISLMVKCEIRFLQGNYKIEKYNVPYGPFSVKKVYE